MRPFITFGEGFHKNYAVRTSLYGDVWFTKWELKLVHTRCFQRLYDIKQLGFADKVYPDAIHSRFNHSLGVLEQGDRIAAWTKHNVKDKHKEIEQSIDFNIDVVRIVGLLHDIFHIPFGHTLEEEIQIFTDRHDEDINRKIKILDLIFSEVLFWEYENRKGVTREKKLAFWQHYKNYNVTELQRLVETFFNFLKNDYSDFLKFSETFAKASEVLLFMGNHVIYEKENINFGWDISRLPLTHKICKIKQPLFDPLQEYYIVDIIGNTISADLLDYALRDMKHAGLTATYDNRLLQYFTISKIKEKKSFKVVGDGRARDKEVEVVHIAINLYDKRIRIDALSEILRILNIRYLLTERVLFHRTKCAVSAMLGKTIRLLELPENEINNFFFCGDAELLSYFEENAERKISSAQEKNSEEKKRYIDTLMLIEGIRSRHYYKPIFHMKSIDNLRPEENNNPAKLLSDKHIRSEIEKEIENSLGLPNGSIIIYCPNKTHLKEAECLVIVDRASRVKKVKELEKQQGFEHYGAEANIVAKKYGILWNMYLFVPKRFVCYWKLIEEQFKNIFDRIRKEKRNEFPGIISIQQDDDLKNYLENSNNTIDVEYEKIKEQMGTTALLNIIRNYEKETQEEFIAVAQRNLWDQDNEKAKAVIDNFSYPEGIKSLLNAQINKNTNEL